MKWKFASYMTLGCVLAFGAINGLLSVAQQPGSTPPGSTARGEQLRGISQRVDQQGGGPPGPTSNFSQQPRYVQPNGGMPGVFGGSGLTPPEPPSGFGGGIMYSNPNGPRMVPYTRTIKNSDGTEMTVTEMRLPEDVRRSSEDHQGLRESVSKLRANNASESDKKAARETIEEFLKDEFERDQKNRKEHVERLEEQVSNLRKQLDKRQESQSKIIALRMQLLENDAEGLSFPEGFNELQNMNGGNPREGGYSPTPPIYQPYVGGGQNNGFPRYPQPAVPYQAIPGSNPSLNPNTKDSASRR